MPKVKEITVDPYLFVVKTLKQFGYKATDRQPDSKNGVDVFAIREDRVLSIEIKRATKVKKAKVLRVRKVEENRKSDDMVAIVFPNGYVLLEPMRDHLKSCNKSGERYLSY